MISPGCCLVSNLARAASLQAGNAGMSFKLHKDETQQVQVRNVTRTRRVCAPRRSHCRGTGLRRANRGQSTAYVHACAHSQHEHSHGHHEGARWRQNEFVRQSKAKLVAEHRLDVPPPEVAMAEMVKVYLITRRICVCARHAIAYVLELVYTTR